MDVRVLNLSYDGCMIQAGQTPAKHWPRRAERLSLTGEALLRSSGKKGYPVRVFDASALGCSCEFIDRPKIADRIWVKFDGVEALEAEGSCLEESRSGVKFVKPIHPAVFDMLSLRLRSSAGADRGDRITPSVDFPPGMATSDPLQT